MDNWSEKVRALEAAGMTLTEIARQTGMSLPGVSDVKQGRTRNPGGMPAVRLHELYERLVAGVAPRPADSATTASVVDAAG